VKLAIAWLSSVLFIASCSLNHRSGEYSCTLQSDCTTPRVCEDGFCIVPAGTPIDAPTTTQHDGPVSGIDANVPPHPDAPVQVTCPSQCTSCDLQAMSCRIECNASNNFCTNEVVCPPGYDCSVGCNSTKACSNGVVCTGTTSCTITCGGSQSCKNITCGDGPCDVTCNGPGSCHNVNCEGSCACDVSCTGVSTGTSGQTCQGVTCSAITCGNLGGSGCSSQDFGCDTCTM
jgi:hypothetical protein